MEWVKKEADFNVPVKSWCKDMNFALDYAKENRRIIMDGFMAAFHSVFEAAEFEAPVNIHHNYAALESHFGKAVWVHRKGATSAKTDETGIIPGSMGTASYIRKPWYRQGGDTLRGSMSSLSDAGFNCPDCILRTEEHML
jgi:RNA-splicing ligase RtcB